MESLTRCRNHPICYLPAKRLSSSHAAQRSSLHDILTKLGGMKLTGLASILRSYLSVSAAIAVLYAGTSGCIHAQVRFEIRSVETVTLKTQQFLIGDKNGSPAMLAGELRIPRPGTDKLSAVILIHGSGGIGSAYDRWAQEINSVGVAVFILDSFSGRGIAWTNACRC